MYPNLGRFDSAKTFANIKTFAKAKMFANAKIYEYMDSEFISFSHKQ